VGPPFDSPDTVARRCRADLHRDVHA
jgi:hypothetical protein